jgi:hypothetical protein
MISAIGTANLEVTLYNLCYSAVLPRRGVMKIQVLKALVSPNMKDTAMYDGHAYPPFRTMPGLQRH